MADRHLYPAPSGLDRFAPNESLKRHAHASAYAAIVLEGSYEEAGSAGRRRVEAGWVVLHDAFDSHCNRFSRSGCRVWNLPFPDWMPPSTWALVADPERVMRVAQSDIAAARSLLMRELRPAPAQREDWPDLLCEDLRRDPGISLTQWARTHGVSRETLSRKFGAIFGAAPSSFRLEARARNAFRRLRSREASLAQIAAQTGFSDQAHMTRAIRRLTGKPPSAWRMSHSFKTARARRD